MTVIYRRRFTFLKTLWRSPVIAAKVLWRKIGGIPSRPCVLLISIKPKLREIPFQDTESRKKGLFRFNVSDVKRLFWCENRTEIVIRYVDFSTVFLLETPSLMIFCGKTHFLLRHFES